MYSDTAFRDGLRAQWRSLSASFYTELHELVDYHGAKLFMRLFEPFMVVGVALCWHTLMSASPPYGTNRLLFLVTGYYPVHLLIEVASGFWMASKRGANLRRYPVETMLDQVLVGAFLEAVIYIAAGVLGLAIIYTYITPDAFPFDIGWVAFSAFQCIALGFAIGLCNAFIQQHVKIWRMAWIALSRALILFSGIFYVPSFLPVQVRDIMAWNPAMQCVETFRFGFYDGYPKLSYFPLYFWSVTLSLALIGLAGDRLFRRYVKT